ncbi:hypothetical protein DMA11_21640 [Marinilabiliaceae bacterium JC017]|nr:hypothetical protein DMA11_21640 [Marinilabiliaceae bacterium JC017]
MSNIIDNFREKFGTFLLKKNIKKLVRQKRTHNLQTAQTAGIIFDASQPDHVKQAKALIADLKKENITCRAVGYIDSDKREDEYISDHTFLYIDKTAFSLFYQPKEEGIQQFITEPFHLLINLCQENYFAVKYILSLSQANFKIGQTGIDNDLFDLMIELTPKSDSDQLRKQIIHYLRIINQA